MTDQPLKDAQPEEARMRLYVWNNPEWENYGGLCLYVIAETEAAARIVAQSARVAHFGEDPWQDAVWGDRPLGPPSRVHELPYAEIYRWAE